MSQLPRSFLAPILRRIGPAAIVLASACGHPAREPTLVACLATTTLARVALRKILGEYACASRTAQMRMKAWITAYSKHSGAEPPALMFDELLGWETMEQGFFAQTEVLADVVQVRAAIGTTNDVADTLEGAALRRGRLVMRGCGSEKAQCGVGSARASSQLTWRITRSA